MTSLDHHKYERSCDRGTCVCRKDGVVTSTFAARSDECGVVDALHNVEWQRWE
jgi:hypothetical protein